MDGPAAKHVLFFFFLLRPQATQPQLQPVRPGLLHTARFSFTGLVKSDLPRVPFREYLWSIIQISDHDHIWVSTLGQVNMMEEQSQIKLMANT